jgi:SsrA-binding protein
MKDFKGIKILSENKKAYFDYEILEKFEAGMVLSGQEVKSIKSGKISLKSSYVVFNEQEPFLIGAKVPAYQPKNAPSDYDPEKSRKLLLKKTEIKHLIGKVSERGIALIPLKIYVKNAMVKLEFGIAKGRKKFSKKEMIKKRENQREVQRELKSRG